MAQRIAALDDFAAAAGTTPTVRLQLQAAFQTIFGLADVHMSLQLDSTQLAALGSSVNVVFGSGAAVLRVLLRRTPRTEAETPGGCRLAAIKFANFAASAALAVMQRIGHNSHPGAKHEFVSNVATPQAVVPWLRDVTAALAMAFDGPLSGSTRRPAAQSLPPLLMRLQEPRPASPRQSAARQGSSQPASIAARWPLPAMHCRPYHGNATPGQFHSPDACSAPLD